MRRKLTLAVWYNEDERVSNEDVEARLGADIRHLLFNLKPNVMVVDNQVYDGYKHEHMEVIDNE